MSESGSNVRAPRGRVAINMALAAVLVAGAAGVVAQLSSDGSATVAVKAAAPLFRLRGTATGLYPGKRITLRAKVRNPYGFAIVVRKVKAKVSSPVAACPRSAVKVARWKGSRVVQAHGRRRIPLRITMRRTAPNACQGVRFRLSFTGTAVRR